MHHDFFVAHVDVSNPDGAIVCKQTSHEALLTKAGFITGESHTRINQSHNQ